MQSVKSFLDKSLDSSNRPASISLKTVKPEEAKRGVFEFRSGLGNFLDCLASEIRTGRSDGDVGTANKVTNHSSQMTYEMFMSGFP